jgi:hypothetical protein
MKYALFAIVALAVAVFAMASGGERYITVTQAQEPPPPPQSLTAVNGLNLGTATLTWTTVPGVSSYRVGWLAKEDYLAYIDNDIWRQKFAYSDVIASSTYTVVRLTPGADYYLIVGRKHDGDIAWSGWQELTLSADVASCPVAEPPMATSGDYDADNDGLIEIRTLAQLDVIRYDLDGDNRISSADEGAYYSAFPDAITGMGCPFDGCIGFELAANLDFDTNGNRHADAGAAYWNDVNGWQPIAVRSPTKFTATFDGGGHTIANLYTRATGNRFNRTGLFGSTGAGSDIRGVGLVSASVTGNSSVGGLVGHNDLGHITDSYVTGSVSGSSQVGGLVGDNTGTITDSYFKGNVNGSNKHAGGLVGSNTSPGRITGGHATGRVSGDESVGGLVGYSGPSATITNSYATGRVTGDYKVGGLVGSIHDSTITDSYAIGSVIGGSSGGLVGESTYGIGDLTSASYWDTQTTGQTSSGGSEDSAGKTTAELQTPTSASGIYATWDPDVWDFGTSSQYPVLKVAGLSVAEQR